MTTEQHNIAGQPYSGFEPQSRKIVTVRAQPSKWQTAWHVFDTLLLIVLVAFAVAATVKYVQIEHGIRDFGNEISKTFGTDPSSDPGTSGELPTCEFGQTFGCTDAPGG